MSNFDVRTESQDIERITFADKDTLDYRANIIEPYKSGFKLKDEDSDRYVYIKDKAHADNLRKALDKAEQLGWLK